MNGPVVSTAIPLVVGATQIAATGPGYYCGLVVRETSGSACVLRVWDNAAAASGTLLDVVALTANQSFPSFTSILPVRYNNGIFVERVSGTNYEGSIRVA